MTTRAVRAAVVVLMVSAGVSLVATGYPREKHEFAGLVPFNVLTQAALNLLGYSNITESSVDGAYAVYRTATCASQIPDRQAIDISKEVIGRFPWATGGRIVRVNVETPSPATYRVLGTIDLFCPNGASEPAGTVVMIRRTFEESSWFQAFAIGGLPRTGPSDMDLVPVEWTDNWEKPDYLGFLRHDGKAWAFAVLANGERLIVFDLRGHVVVDQNEWSAHLVREGDDVVLYTILIEPAPESAIDRMPGKNLEYKKMALSQYRTWALHKIGKGSDEVITSAPLVPKFRGRYDNNPEIEKRSAPVVKKARALFDTFRKEGRIIDQLP